MGRPETWRGLLDRVEPGWDTPEREDAIRDHFHQSTPTPWFLHVLSGFGGLLAGVFFGGFFACIFGDEPAPYLMLGSMFVIAAIVGRKTIGAVESSLRMALTSLSLTGLGMVAFALAEMGLKDPGLPLVFVGISGVLYLLNEDEVHRFFMATLGGQLALYLATFHGGPWLGYIVTLAAALAIVFAFGLERHIGAAIYKLRPALYGWLWVLFSASSAAAAGRGFDLEWSGGAAMLEELPVRVVMTLALLVAVILASRENEERGPILWGAGFAALLAALSTSGVLAGLLMLFLGTWRQRRPLIIAGALCLLGFLSHYYYSLQLELWSKALVLVSSGGVLLLLRVVLHQQPWMKHWMERAREEVSP